MNKYIKPFFNVIIVAGIIHLGISLVLIIKNSDPSYWNVFYIVSASDLFPGIEKGLISGIISILIVGSTYFFFYTKNDKKTPKQKDSGK